MDLLFSLILEMWFWSHTYQILISVIPVTVSEVIPDSRQCDNDQKTVTGQQSPLLPLIFLDFHPSFETSEIYQPTSAGIRPDFGRESFLSFPCQHEDVTLCCLLYGNTKSLRTSACFRA